MRLKEHVKIKWEINFFNTKFRELNKKKLKTNIKKDKRNQQCKNKISHGNRNPQS